MDRLRSLYAGRWVPLIMAAMYLMIRRGSLAEILPDAWGYTDYWGYIYFITGVSLALVSYAAGCLVRRYIITWSGVVISWTIVSFGSFALWDAVEHAFFDVHTFSNDDKIFIAFTVLDLMICVRNYQKKTIA